jgi:hypothetical protein
MEAEEQGRRLHRRSTRNAAKAHVRLVINTQSYCEKLLCLIVDISEKGLRVRGNLGLKPGLVVGITPSEIPKLMTCCRVVWVSEPGPKQETGLQVLIPPLRLTECSRSN